MQFDHEQLAAERLTTMSDSTELVEWLMTI